MLLAALAASVPLAGCQTNTQTGAALGTGAGALAGAIIGHQVGHTKTGAALGALGGALGGAAVGNAVDAREERDAAVRQAAHAQAAQHAAARAVTNSDLIYMSQQGVSEAIIINTIRTRGGRFRTDPQSIIALQQGGVSQQVILEAQQYPAN
jgi:uncharacterized protein YcfJ